MRLMIFIGILLCSASIFASETKIDWKKSVTLEVDGKSVGEAISQIVNQTDTVVLLSRNVNGTDGAIWKEPLYLQGKSLTLRQSVDWLATLLDCRYHITPDNKILFDYGYSWVDTHDFDMILRNVENLIGQTTTGGLAEFEKSMSEVTKILTLFDSGFYARIEEQGKQIKFVANLPADLKPLCESVLRNLEVSGDSIGKAAPATIQQQERELISKLYAPVVAAYRERLLPEVIADLALQSGVNIGFSQSLFRGGAFPKITLDKGNLSLRAALEQVVALTPLKGIELSLPNGIWLGNYPVKWGKMSGREYLWKNNAVVRSYSLRETKNTEVDGNFLAYQIKMKVSPQSWQDPLASVLYHEPSGNLLVISSAEVQQHVYDALTRYLARARKSNP